MAYLLWFLVISLIVGMLINDAIQTNSWGTLPVFGPIFLIFYLFAILKIRQGVKRFELYLISELKENKNVLQDII